MANSRAVAALVLKRIVNDHCSIKVALSSVGKSQPSDPRDKAFIQELVYGVCRWYFDLEHELSQLLNKPLRRKDHDIKCLLLIGLYQLIHLDTPHHATVQETVAAAKDFKKPWAKGLLNACLRQAIRNKLGTERNEDTINARNQPQWLVEEIERDWPDTRTQILAAYNERPPLCLRVNITKISREQYLQCLVDAGLNASATQYSECGIKVTPAVDTLALPGFDEGLVSVQDEAAQLAASILCPQANERILDACAAPGGKSGHLIEFAGNHLALTTLDLEPERLQLVAENLTRLGFSAELLCGDATRPDTWWNNQAFDKILVDAPCSATGILRRQPDIKIHRRLSDITNLVELQHDILQKLWPLLKPQGTLLYSTCSILNVENENLMAAFVDSQKDCDALKLTANWGRDTGKGRQILPGDSDMDGFYYCLLRKSKPANY